MQEFCQIGFAFNHWPKFSCETYFMGITMKIEEIKAKYAILNDAASDKKKRYEVHFQAQDAKGNIFNLVKEAVCKPGELKAILKKFESEQKAKGNKIVSELYRKSFAVDSVSVNDASNEKLFFEVLSKNGRVISRIKAPETISTSIANRLADQESAKAKKPWAKCRIVNSSGNVFETYRRNLPYSGTRELVARNIDSAELNDKYDLGLNVNKNVPNAPVKVLTVTTKKEQDGVSGTVKFSKGGKNYAERFMVYSSGNWDVKPISNPGMNYSSADRETLMNAARNKLATLGIKAK